MKILLVNKFHYLKGGSEKYYFELANLLKEKGHQIAFFSMKDERNIHTGDKEYFVKPIDLNSGSKLEAINVIYSKENKKKMEEALNDFKPDIVHINNFQRQLSASIIYAISKHNVPIVFTAHDLEAICPNKTMLDSNKEICEKCLHGSYINCIRKKCIKDSLLKSTLGALETKFYKQNNIYTKKIDFIITPSEFYRNKFIEYGVEKDKIEAIHNWIDINTEQSEVGDRKYAFRENIRYGKLNATDEEVEAAAKLSNADRFIKHLSKGYDTMIDGSGEGLSQGQRQLLSIARAALNNPPVLILDEATSSIDTRTEKIVQDGMDQLMKGRTVFVIAHRLSTIKNSDLIMVLDHGTIMERGKHEDLIKKHGMYYGLYTGKIEID